MFFAEVNLSRLFTLNSTVVGSFLLTAQYLKKMFPITPAKLRIYIQSIMSLFYIWVGYNFYHFYQFMIGSGNTPVTKPGAVEGFLPISALLSLNKLISEGIFDEVHPAGLTIFIAVLIMSFIFRKGFCAYLCPAGFISNVLNSIGLKIKCTIRVKGKIELALLIPKYIAMIFFVYAIFFQMGPREINAFIYSAYNFTAEARMMHFFTHMSIIPAISIVTIALLSIVIPFFWCRFLCPYGALLGLLSKISPISIKRDEELCISCGKCTKSCPGGIEVNTKKTINSAECIGCSQCIGSCPVDDCLQLTDKVRSKAIPWTTVAVGSFAILMLYYVVALCTDHWNSPVPIEELRKYYMQI